MKELLYKIKRERLPKEVLFLLGILINKRNVYRDYYTVDILYKPINRSAYILFSINENDRTIKINSYEISIILNDVIERKPVNIFKSMDNNYAASAIQLSEYSDYKMVYTIT